MHFKFNIFNIGGFIFAESNGNVGDHFPLNIPEEIPYDKQSIIFAITGGRYSLGPFDPDGKIYDMPKGFSSHLIQFRPPGQRVIVCQEDNSTYLCIRPENDAPYGCKRKELKAGESSVVNTNTVFVSLLGDYNINGMFKSAPLISHAKNSALDITAITDFIGLEVYLT